MHAFKHTRAYELLMGVKKWCVSTDNHVAGFTCTTCMYPPHPDLIQLINVKAVQELILWPRLDHAVNKVYKLSALMTYIYCLSCYSCTIDVLNELCMMLPAGVHNVCLQTSTDL